MDSSGGKVHLDPSMDLFNSPSGLRDFYRTAVHCTTCSCVGPCDKPSCISNLKYKLQYSAENRRLNRQCACTNRRPKCLRRRRRRQNLFCDCEEMEMPTQNKICHDCNCPLYSDTTIKTPPPQHKTILRARSRSKSPGPQINLFSCTAQAPTLRPTVPGCQARPPTPATKEAGTYTNMEETPPSEPPRFERCIRSRPTTPVCPKKTVCTCTTMEEGLPSEPSSPRFRYTKSRNASPDYPRKPCTTTAETETVPNVSSPSFVRKSCMRSKQHSAVCPKRILEKAASFQRPDRQTMRTRSPSPTCNKETCHLNDHHTRSSENSKRICVYTDTNDQEDIKNNLKEKNIKNICRFTVDAYFV